MDAVASYAQSVLSGQTVASQLVRLACERHLHDLEEGQARGLTWDVEAANRVFRFFNTLRHSKGQFAGTPFTPLPWQAFCIGNIYGWKRADGTRRYRRASIWVSKKSGKSTTAAAIILYSLFADNEPGAEVYGAAADRNQASIIYREVVSMIRQQPTLAKRLRVVETTRRVVCQATNSFYAVLSKDSHRSGHGVNGSTCVIDELHVVDRDLHDTLRYAGAARRQPLLIEISTAGNDRDSIGFERYTYSKRMLLGETAPDEETFSFIAEADSNDAWQEEEQWYKANPSLGVTISLDSFRGDFHEAQNSSPATQANFKQLRLNLWQDSVHTWIPLEKWDSCAGEFPDVTGCPCWGGLDLSAKMDLTAWIMCFVVDDEFWLKAFFWAPKAGDNRRHEQNRTLLQPWMAKGFIHGIDGDTIDTDIIEKQVIADCERYRVMKVILDDWNALSVTNHLMGTGIEVEPFPQTLRNYNEPMKEFERLVYEGRIRHDGNPVLRWCVANTAAYKDGSGNIRPDKKHSGDRIDGVTASLMAFAKAMTVEGWSVYETQGLDAI